MGWMDCPPVSPGGGSEVPEALLEPGVGAATANMNVDRNSKCKLSSKTLLLSELTVIIRQFFI